MKKVKYDGVGLLSPEEGMPKQYFEFLDNLSNFFVTTAWLHTSLNQEKYNNCDSVACTFSNFDFNDVYDTYITFIESKAVVTIAGRQNRCNIRVIKCNLSIHPKQLGMVLRGVFKVFEPQARIRMYPWQYNKDLIELKL